MVRDRGGIAKKAIRIIQWTAMEASPGASPVRIGWKLDFRACDNLGVCEIPPASLKSVATAIQQAPVVPGFQLLVGTGSESLGTTVATLYQATSPLIFESLPEGGEYGIAGSSFLVRYRGRHWVITAGHCLQGGDGRNVRVALNPVTGTFLPLMSLRVGHTPRADSDHADVAIFEAEPERLTPEDQQARVYFDLDQLAGGDGALTPETELITPGYPREHNFVDYDAIVIVATPYAPGGLYAGTTGDVHNHFIHYQALDEVESVQGLSGSPVIMLLRQGGWVYFSLAGMLLRADRNARIGRFVEARALVRLLDRIIAGDA